MTSSSQVRAWWDAWECQPSRYTKVSFPGEGRSWALSVADASAPVWRAVAQIMESEPYLFRESAGGTYNCRPPSLHAYALALDLNPSVNPMRNPLTHEYPDTFITRMEGIRASGNQAIMWGGRWSSSNPPDAMHWQINVAPEDCSYVTWDQGGTTPAPEPPDYEWEEPELAPSDFARQLNYWRVGELCKAKVAGTWVVSPDDENREGVTDYWSQKLDNPDDPEWADFYRAILGGGQMAAAMSDA